MTPDQYHTVLVALDQALKVFQDAGTDGAPADQALYRQLEIIRSQCLKLESGHPFPFLPTAPPFTAGAPAAESPAGAPAALEAPAPRPSAKIRVLIADDHLSVRSVLQAMLKTEADFEVVGEAKNGAEAVELARASRPDVIVMDLNMPVLDGISATREALRVSPGSKVIVFSANRDATAIRLSAAAGAVGYLCKPAIRPAFITALRDVHRGQTAFEDPVASSAARQR